MAVQRFCGNCGTNIKAAFQHDLAQYQEELKFAQELIRQYRFKEANASLRPLKLVSDPRFVDLVESANSESLRIKAEQAKWEARCASAIKSAQQKIDEHDYSGAEDLLQAIPLPVRSSDLDNLLHRAATFSAEVRELGERIVADYKARKLERLGVGINRLLDLQPEHPRALKLAEELKERIAFSAQKQLKKHNFSRAVSLMSLMPVVAVDKETDALTKKSKELQWLQQTLERSPVVDRTLAVVAGRLAKAAPDFPKIAAVVKEIDFRLQQPGNPEWLAARDWRCLDDDQNTLGFPVHWVGGYRRIQVAARQQPNWKDFADRSFVATGLALHGIGHSALPVALNAGKRGLLGMGRKKAKAAWGIDISSTAIKAVRLERQGAAVVLTRFGEVAIPDIPSEDQRPAIESQALHRLNQQLNLGDAVRIVSLPRYSTISKFVEMPRLEGKRATQAIKYEAAHQFPIQLDQLVWDHCTVCAQPEQPTNRTLLVAIKKADLERAAERLFKPLKLSLDELQPDGTALVNYLAYEHGERHLAATASSSTCVAVVDVGASQSCIAMIGPHMRFYHRTTIGGSAISGALARKLQLRIDQAEQLKRTPHKLPQFHSTYGDLEGLFTQLRNEITTAVQRGADVFGGAQVERLFLGGGGARIHGLIRHLTTSR